MIAPAPEAPVPAAIRHLPPSDDGGIAKGGRKSFTHAFRRCKNGPEPMPRRGVWADA